MDFEQIKKFIREKDYFFSKHADEERTKDNLTAGEIEQAILAGKVIKERPDDPRGESRLVVGKTPDGRILHVVIGTRLARPIVVTVYLPKQQKWVRGIIRRRKQ